MNSTVKYIIVIHLKTAYDRLFGGGIFMVFKLLYYLAEFIMHLVT